ncbi:MAG: glycosyltransferase [Candidatus Shapirobacteria bacterium]|nr:glycosyltransferase [Candidatus Shapirobacteria bacterium]
MKYKNKYNNSDSLLVISFYPNKGETYSAGATGVASYTKNIISNLHRKVVVLANKQINSPDKTYQENNSLVIRCFISNTPKMWSMLWKQIRSFNQIKNIHIQYDSSMYGGILTSGLIIPFVTLLRIFGYKVSITLHHVVDDVLQLRGQVGLKETFIDTIKGKVYNIIFHVFYWILALFTNKFIVLEETLVNKLLTIAPHAKVTAIAHGVDNNLKTKTKIEACHNLKINPKDFVIIFFGYINWFKGADFFVKAFSKVNKILGRKTHFFIAGGSSPTLGDKPYYQSFYQSIKKEADKSKSLFITGYVKQEDIANYFAATDLVVFPYRHYMTASGVLSLVFSYKKPFIISNKIEEMFNAPDFKQAFLKSNLKKSDLTFRLTPHDCQKTATKVLKNGLIAKTINMTKYMSESRDFVKTADLYDQALFGASIKSKNVIPLYRYELSSE